MMDEVASRAAPALHSSGGREATQRAAQTAVKTAKISHNGRLGNVPNRARLAYANEHRQATAAPTTAANTTVWRGRERSDTAGRGRNPRGATASTAAGPIAGA